MSKNVRLKIKERLYDKNENRKKGGLPKLNMKQLALLVYEGDETNYNWKQSRLSGFNTGRLAADVNDVKKICSVLNCEPNNLIDF